MVLMVANAKLSVYVLSLTVATATLTVATAMLSVDINGCNVLTCLKVSKCYTYCYNVDTNDCNCNA